MECFYLFLRRFSNNFDICYEVDIFYLFIIDGYFDKKIFKEKFIVSKNIRW